eukprot:SM011687S25269  [mRNA]  locus=s11687:298:411:- [translate_table: standard]
MPSTRAGRALVAASGSPSSYSDLMSLTRGF